MPSRRAASEMLPPQSLSTRWMCSHSFRASEGAGNAMAPSGTLGSSPADKGRQDIVRVSGLAEEVDGTRPHCVDGSWDAAES